MIGTGNVSWHLTHALKSSGIMEVFVVGRNAKAAKKIAASSHATPIIGIENAPQNVDLFMICVSDGAIAEVAENLPKTKAIVAHSSGAAAMNLLSTYPNFGVFYPLQTFTKGVPVSFLHLPILVEGNNSETTQALENLAKKVSQNAFLINSAQREKLHVAAVFANNFTNHMLAQAFDFCQKNNVPFETLHSLILETARKATLQNPAENQTGPAVRNDQKTIEKHQQSLTDENQLALYNFITQSIKITQ